MKVFEGLVLLICLTIIIVSIYCAFPIGRIVETDAVNPGQNGHPSDAPPTAVDEERLTKIEVGDVIRFNFDNPRFDYWKCVDRRGNTFYFEVLSGEHKGAVETATAKDLIGQVNLIAQRGSAEWQRIIRRFPSTTTQPR